MNVEWSFSIQSTQSQQGISFGWIIKIIICWRVSEVPCDSITLCTVSVIRTLASFFSRWAALLTYLAASVPLTLALVMSNTFLFFDFSAVFEQISSCFSILSSAKFLPHILQAVRSSRGFGANMDFLAGVEGVWKYYVSCVFLGWNICFVMGLKDSKIHVSTGMKQGINLIPLLNISPFSWARGRAELIFWHLWRGNLTSCENWQRRARCRWWCGSLLPV